ncbi:hypothetical protein COCCADRAFT_41590 [Bipolaris zeicola 26-R-13]|uniref:Uncharacterized protein n=1 Tax=Cochliobolus carbonum (strain 26-R-13) TaxID=930089 RepID=W6Y9J8_COCC2|nr:uncharacterized protein COCCADRAFT_41590 [Bipolaris zeicola 26-R-13]EUC27766.1 hypothetical protein COCCADRAFT_41590 [Bipolaris zeicola 26-R-13]
MDWQREYRRGASRPSPGPKPSAIAASLRPAATATQRRPRGLTSPLKFVCQNLNQLCHHLARVPPYRLCPIQTALPRIGRPSFSHC